MDLSTIKTSTLKVEISHPASGEPTGLVVECLPRSAPEVKKVVRIFIDKATRRRSSKPLTASEIEERSIEILAVRIVGLDWGGTSSWKGKKLERTDENVRELLAQDWFKAQVEEAIGDEAGFFES